MPWLTLQLKTLIHLPHRYCDPLVWRVQLAAAASRGPVLLHDHWTLYPVKRKNLPCMSGSISAHALFIFLGEMHYTSLQSIYPLSSLFLCGCFLEFDMQDTRLRIDCWRVAPYQWNLFFKLQRAHFLQQGSRRTELNYLHRETQTTPGMDSFTQWTYFLKGDGVVPCSVTFLTAVHVYIPPWMYVCGLFHECHRRACSISCI